MANVPSVSSRETGPLTVPPTAVGLGAWPRRTSWSSRVSPGSRSWIQDNEANRGRWRRSGRWRLLFLVDSPQQRRLGVRDSFDLAWQDWQGSAGWDRLDGEHPQERVGGPLGPRHTSSSRPARSGRGCSRRACGSPRGGLGRAGRQYRRGPTATRCRGSTSRGAPGPGISSRSADRARAAAKTCSVRLITGTGSTP